MMKMNVIEYLICVYIALILIIGCASVGQLTPQAATTASNAVTVAQGLLHSLDTFYGDLVALKMAPDYRVEATKALAIADAAAASLRGVIAGASVTDANLNILAGQVAGAKAILAGVK